MFGITTCHVIQNPTGSFSFVGSVPVVLGREVPATDSDVFGCRAYRNEKGELVAIKLPVFETREKAVEFAASKGVEIAS